MLVTSISAWSVSPKADVTFRRPRPSAQASGTDIHIAAAATLVRTNRPANIVLRFKASPKLEIAGVNSNLRQSAASSTRYLRSFEAKRENTITSRRYDDKLKQRLIFDEFHTSTNSGAWSCCTAATSQATVHGHGRHQCSSSIRNILRKGSAAPHNNWSPIVKAPRYCGPIAILRTRPTGMDMVPLTATGVSA